MSGHIVNHHDCNHIYHQWAVSEQSGLGMAAIGLCIAAQAAWLYPVAQDGQN
jgi:hypothetical protein